MDNRINIKENKSWGPESGPRFILSFSRKASEEQKRKTSYDVLSKLIGDSDVLVEINGSLLNLPPKDRDSYASRFIEDIKALGLEYRCSKITALASNSLLNLFGNKTTQEKVVAAYIPNEIWSKAQMQDLICLFGTRYFVLKEKTDVSETLDYFQRMDESERVDYFKLIAFDAMCLNTMSIFTNNYNLSNIKDVLEIS